MIFDARNDIMSKNNLHTDPKCVFYGQKMWNKIFENGKYNKGPILK